MAWVSKGSLKGPKGDQGQQGPPGTVDAAQILDIVYPVGSIYLSTSAVSPQTFLGGTWESIEGRFLLCADSSHEAGTTGGSNDAVVVSHSHSASSGSATPGVTVESAGGHSHTGTAASAGSHSHDAEADSAGSHSHSISGGSHTHTASTNNTGGHTHAYPFYSYRTNPTPEGWDTSSRFVVQSGGIRSSGGATSSNGSHSHSVTVATSSSHSHTASSSGAHAHSVTVDSDGAHTHSVSTVSSGSHTHDASVEAHSHTVTVQSAGEGGDGKNMPAYLAVNAWRRTA